MQSTPTQSNDTLLSRDELLAALFTESSRPSLRTFETWKKRKVISFVRIGRLHFYSLPAVRAALAARFTVNAARTAAN